jgi:hypothetical protein
MAISNPRTHTLTIPLPVGSAADDTTSPSTRERPVFTIIFLLCSRYILISG